MGIFLLVAFYVVLCRLENDHVTDGAALLAPGDNAADERLPAPISHKALEDKCRFD